LDNLEKIKHRIFSKNTLFKQIKQWKIENKKIVFTNGCFDILHQGHITYLSQAADCGDKLIIAINSDNSVKRLNKGKNRPIQDEYSRVLIIAALNFVSAVVIFDDDTPFSIISDIKPDVLIKGGDYDVNIKDKLNKKYIVGSDIVLQNRGIVKVIPFVEGFSTSKIEQKLKSS